MKVLSKKQENYVILFGLIFSFIIFLVGIHIFLDEQDLKSHSNAVDATITNINKHCDMDDDCNYDIDITYNVNGVDYHNIITYYDASMHVGGTTKIYYDINDPMHISSGNTGLLFLVLGFIFTLFLSILFFTNLKKIKSSKHQELLNNGIKVLANIIRIETAELNNRPSYQIVLSYVSPFDNNLKEIKTDRIYFDVGKIINEKNITNLYVYFEQSNENNYYIDLSLLNQ